MYSMGKRKIKLLDGKMQNFFIKIKGERKYCNCGSGSFHEEFDPKNKRLYSVCNTCGKDFCEVKYTKEYMKKFQWEDKEVAKQKEAIKQKEEFKMSINDFKDRRVIGVDKDKWREYRNYTEVDYKDKKYNNKKYNWKMVNQIGSDEKYGRMMISEEYKLKRDLTMGEFYGSSTVD